MADIFISYATEDRERIRPLALALSNAGWTVFWDRTIKAGQIWQKVIGRELTQAGCVVVAWSHASIISDWVQVEAGEGRDRGVLIPLSLDAVALPFGFRQIHSADLTHWQGDVTSQAFRDLLDAIADKIGPPSKHSEVPPSEKPMAAESPVQAAAVEEAPAVIDPPFAPEQSRRGLSRPLLGLGAVLSLAGIGAVAVFQSQPPADSAGKKPIPIEGATEPAALIKPGVPSTRAPSSPPVPTVERCPQCPEMVPLPSLGIAMGKTEVTQSQWQHVMGNNPSKYQACGADCPVEEVSYEDVQSYIKKLNELAPHPAKPFRLPTEDEWFAACQAGQKHDYCGSNDLDAVAWYGEDWSKGSTHPVGKKQKNAWDLHDMSGNVSEWISNCYDNDCIWRVIRGGAWGDFPGAIRSAERVGGRPVDRYLNLGFRLAQDL